MPVGSSSTRGNEVVTVAHVFGITCIGTLVRCRLDSKGIEKVGTRLPKTADNPCLSYVWHKRTVKVMLQRALCPTPQWGVGRRGLAISGM